MSFVEAIKSGFQNYFNFTGRASRSEFWWFYLALMIMSYALAFIIGLLFGTGETSDGIIAFLTIALTIPLISAACRRLADAGKSWANILWVFLPLAGIFILIYKLVQRSEYTNPAWS